MNEQTTEHILDLAGIGIGDVAALESLLLARDQLPGLEAAPATGGAALRNAYRAWGHLAANLDPLGLAQRPLVADLSPARHDLDARQAASLVAALEAAYCGTIGWEFAHCADPAVRAWFEAEAEASPQPPDPAEAERAARLLARVYGFEAALSRRIPGGKLFGLGGAETFILALETLLRESVAHGTAEVVIGGMHRGRFAMLSTFAGKPLTDLVAGVLGKPPVPEGLGLSADVSYHLGWSGDIEVDGRPVHLSISPHPSHLQLAPVIAQGRARAKQARHGAQGRRSVLPLLLHTDASFGGQGLVAEMLQLSGLPPFHLGGTIHVVIDNQIGFTTTPEEARTARRPTDIARLIEAPVLHVNGDDPEAVIRAARIAARFRAIFARDVLVRLVCYRRPGHNEIDEPRFTQPLMVQAIADRAPVHRLYADDIARRGLDVTAALDAAEATIDRAMGEAFSAAKTWRVNRLDAFEGLWQSYSIGTEPEMTAFVATGVDLDRLKDIGRKMTEPPPGFALDPKVARFLAERRQTIEGGSGLTWATGEALAFATLLDTGVPVRFGGQDSLRGAFTQRHLELHDQSTGARHLVLTPLAKSPDHAEFHNTPLIEHAVLCYEYGLSLADPARLVVWEAQFGEFLNVAQPVFDQCITCGEDRWVRSSGLVLLLPHGLDGGGPDHSTGRPERLMAAAAGTNIQIANASTPANFFHLLRRQMLRPFRKPLVVLTPKALLRNKDCASSLAGFGPGTGFRTVLSEPHVASAERVILCSGKIYYELATARATAGLEDRIAIVRVEQLHPWPGDDLAALLSGCRTDDLVWCEEEPANMGWFTHLDRRLEQLTGRTFRRIGRPAVATPATGVKYWHEAEIRTVIEAALSL
jgi:2-oxoglutarate dehydrogenase E1 component